MTNHSKRNSFLPTLLALALIAGFIACAPETEVDTEDATSDTSMTETTDTSLSDIELSGEEPHLATITDDGISLPATIPAGPQMITVENQGSSNHGFAVSGPGVEASVGRELQTEEVATLAVDLQPGEYRAYCTIHPTMETTFTVTPIAQTEPVEGDPTTTTSSDY